MMVARRVGLETDQEPAIVESMRVSREERLNAFGEMSAHIRAFRVLEDDGQDAVVFEHSPVGGSTSNGAIEIVIKRFHGQIRAIILALQEVVGGPM